MSSDLLEVLVSLASGFSALLGLICGFVFWLWLFIHFSR